MKRRNPEVKDDPSSLIAMIESSAAALLDQKRRNERMDENVGKHVLSALMTLHSSLATSEEQSVDEQKPIEEVEALMKQLEDVMCHNEQLAMLIEASDKKEGTSGSVEQLYQGLAEARSLESLLSQLRQQKAQISAVKRELAGQMALVTGNTSSALDREVRTLSKYIFWKGSSEKVSLSAEVLRLPAPLFVLHQSIQVENEGMAECGVAEISSSDSGLSRWGLDCRIGPVKFKVAFSTVLDLAVASGNHAELQKLGPEGDTGLVSPSLTTLYKVGLNEQTALAALGDFRPYKWVQLLCGIQAARTAEDYSLRLSLRDVLEKVTKK